MSLIFFLTTDMEGLAGVDRYEQCYPDDCWEEAYQEARRLLTRETNAAVAGCFDAGATEVRVLDGHGPNRFEGFTAELDPRAVPCQFASRNPSRWQGLDSSVAGVALIGQHARAGTIGGFLDHSSSLRTICRRTLNGEEHGEIGWLAAYAGHYGIPLIFLSGDEAACREAETSFPWTKTVATKNGLSWESCELYDPETVYRRIRQEMAAAVRGVESAKAWKPNCPVTVETELAWTGLADESAGFPGVERPAARTLRWRLSDVRDIYSWPSANWYPAMSS